MPLQSKKVLTLVLIREAGRVLLGMKKRGFGKGNWNGFGGKVKIGEETIKEGAIREVYEECNLTVSELDKVGILTFEFLGDRELMEVHVFSASFFEGIPKESEEMQPRWFNIKRMPYDQMWPDDRYWFPLYLKGSRFTGYFVFAGLNKIVSQSLREVEHLPAEEATSNNSS